LEIFPDGTIAWNRFELRGDAVAEPPSIDIGSDVLNIERKPAEPARITVTRRSDNDAGFREIFVSLDGEPLTMLQYGDEFTCEVKAGPHRLKAHNTLFWKTRQIVLRPGEHARFTAINRKGPISFGLLFMLGAFPLYLTFERASDVPATDTLLRRHAGG